MDEPSYGEGGSKNFFRGGTGGDRIFLGEGGSEKYCHFLWECAHRARKFGHFQGKNRILSLKIARRAKKFQIFLKKHLDFQPKKIKRGPHPPPEVNKGF